MSFNYIVATIKPWNVDNYHKYFHKKNFFLIDNKADLTFSKIKSIAPRYIFFPHWSWIIPRKIWSNFECVLFHPTDLPYGRGGTPLQNLIIRGHTKTKISVIKVNQGLDTGDIYFKRSLNLSGSAESIYKRMSRSIFKHMIPRIIKYQPIPQKQTGKSVPFIRRTPPESKIKNPKNPKQLYDFIRMLDAPGYPKAFLETKKFKLEFSQAYFKNRQIIAKVEIHEKK